MNHNQGPYINHHIVKEECINHVHKRMRTALLKLVQVTITDYETKGGTKKKKVLSGRDIKISLSLEKSNLDKVKELYTRLTDEDLLKRCLQGKIQNPNESLHSRV
ncbi:hypothetical protein Pcinc_010455 [Petrolisthes cinctipes]|uniref:Uncharacterized protein n=1 Tax=Petrolisthes cinctipes TaxID=88211 RepID=A0AAE1G908_PETCI|nr:hypothetical protein Pcinc_010455 [Petrolisthes cinctipes]